jgi:hypothetical protein
LGKLRTREENALKRNNRERERETEKEMCTFAPVRSPTEGEKFQNQKMKTNTQLDTFLNEIM